jgi:glycosyltransferase involved in cell wall biosynthesis
VVFNSLPVVTFIVPCYNYGCYLSDCLNSIFNQEGEQNFEVIVIDDCSTDNTQEILRNFTDIRLRIITHKENQGHVKTINEGLTLAQGTFVARIDPDDRYRPYFLKSTLEKFYKYPEVAMVYGDAAVINQQGEITLEQCDRVHNNQDFKGNELLRLLEQNFVCAPTVIARREAWLKALPAPQDLAFNDWYFTLMMARENEFYYINEVLAEYRVHNQNHHTKIARNKTEETSIFWLLDKIFNSSEKSQELETQKQKSKSKIYSAHYLDVANKYFGFSFNADARRCYLLALRYRLSYFSDLGLLRRLLATLIKREIYESSKLFVKSIVKPLSKTN